MMNSMGFNDANVADCSRGSASGELVCCCRCLGDATGVCRDAVYSVCSPPKMPCDPRLRLGHAAVSSGTMKRALVSRSSVVSIRPATSDNLDREKNILWADGTLMLGMMASLEVALQQRGGQQPGTR